MRSGAAVCVGPLLIFRLTFAAVLRKMTNSNRQRIVLGLKLKYLREQKGWNFDEMSRKSGISPSYLNEIEKGKKMPREDILNRLAEALETSVEHLTSEQLPPSLAPVEALLQSRFLQELPWGFFGIELQQVIDIIVKAPYRVNAFISATLEIARNYSLQNEHFFLAALRAYQELRMNYFEEIEQCCDALTQENKLLDIPPEESDLQRLLLEKYGVRVLGEGLDAYPELRGLRAVFLPYEKKLLLRGDLRPEQRRFQLAKEIGFHALSLSPRPYSSSLIKVDSFELALNNYKAAYFAVCLLVNGNVFANDLQALFQEPVWRPERIQSMLDRYQVSPEILFQRFNVLSPKFGLRQIFFLRCVYHPERDEFEIDKELHLNRRHSPHATALQEHYCRRWIGLRMLRESDESAIGLQRVVFADEQSEYLCFAVSKPGERPSAKRVSVTIGIQLDDEVRQVIRFWDDPALRPAEQVNVTCERCHIADCRERSAPPLLWERREQRRKLLETLDSLIRQTPS